MFCLFCVFATSSGGDKQPNIKFHWKPWITAKQFPDAELLDALLRPADNWSIQQHWKVFHVASIETIVWHYFCHLVIQSCTGIHHLIGYFSTLYRLTRNLITTQINHLARDLDVSRKLSCVLLNLTNKTFSCNAMSSIIIVFFLTSGQFIAKSLSLSFSWHPKHFLTM